MTTKVLHLFVEETCQECPFVDTRYTQDENIYYCFHPGLDWDQDNQIGPVLTRDDWPPFPEWCPLPDVEGPYDGEED